MPKFHNKFNEKGSKQDHLEESVEEGKYTKSKKDRYSGLSTGSRTMMYEDVDDLQIIEALEAQYKGKGMRKKHSNYIKDHKRSSLPALKPKSSINIFKILKDSIGKDLSKF